MISIRPSSVNWAGSRSFGNRYALHANQSRRVKIEHKIDGGAFGEGYGL